MTKIDLKEFFWLPFEIRNKLFELQRVVDELLENFITFQAMLMMSKLFQRPLKQHTKNIKVTTF